MRWLVLLSLMIAVPLAGGSFQPLRESEYWDGVSGIHDLSFIKRFISNKICWLGVDYDLACRRGIRSVRALLIKSGMPEVEVAALMVPPIDEVSGRSDYDRLLKSFESLEARVPLPMVFGLMASGTIGHFDAHARLVPSKLVNDLFAQTSNDYYGSGIETEVTADGVFIRRILPNSPASASELKVSDRIVAVNGHNVQYFGKRIYESWSTFRGAVDGKVSYQVARLDHPVVLTVSLLSTPVVESQILISKRGRTLRQRVGVVTIRNFGDGVCETVEKKVRDLENQKIKALILDVRSNLGGLIVEGVCVASLFVGNRQILTRAALPVLIPPTYRMGLNPEPSPPLMTEKQRLEASFPKLPVIVLQNAQTASASEIMSAALQDSERAWVVGETSHGKGSSQLVKSLLPGLRVIYTVAQNFRATGDSLQIMGVTPNFDAPFFIGEKRSYLREANLNPTTFRPRLLVKWNETRIQERDQIAICLQQKGLSLVSPVVRRLMGYDDFQLTTGLAVLYCDPNSSTKHNL